MQKIYIVEDDKNIAEIEEFALKNSGFEVYTFSNAKDFDKKMENKYPDLIIMDIMREHSIQKQNYWQET